MLVKGCSGCGATYTEVEWQQLLFLGVQAAPGRRLEMRRCRCQSTLSLKIEAPQAAPEAPHSPFALRPSPLASQAPSPSTRPRAPDARKDTTEPCLPASYYWPPLFCVRKTLPTPSA
jgi:hypothetical protein